MEALIPLLLGPVAGIFVEAAKRVPVVPFDGKSRASIALALLIVSLACRAGLAYLNGNLAALDWQAEARILLDAVASVLVAAGGYSLLKR